MRIVGVLDLIDKATPTLDKVNRLGNKFSGLFSKAGKSAEGDLNKVLRKLDEVDKKASGGFLSGGLGKIAGAAAGLFAVDQVMSFGKGIFAMTAEMQKYEAVLTNTFGSQERAKSSMKDIQDFAAKTPFQINDLTDSYIKLANRGFVPTMDQLTRIGDLASSAGKPFDQLTEAILDAQTGEFERLKEFGIKASKEGNRVTFAFKGQTKQVENSEEAIKNYLLSLGEMQGVGGSMAAISKTLGGQLSNMEDNFGQLQLKIGNVFAEGFGQGFAFMNKGIDVVSQFVDFTQDKASSLRTVFQPFQRAFEPVLAQFNRVKTLLFEGTTAAGFFESAFNTIGNVLITIEPILSGIGNAISTLIDNIIKVVAVIGKWWSESTRTQKVVAAIVKGAVELFAGLFDFLAEGFNNVGKIIDGVFTFDLDKIASGSKGILSPSNSLKLVDRLVKGVMDGYENGLSNLDFFKDKPAGEGQTAIGSFTGAGSDAKSTAATKIAAESGIKGVTGGGAKPTNIYINIDKLNEQINITSSNLSESAGQIEDKMIEILLKVINSANQVYG